MQPTEFTSCCHSSSQSDRLHPDSRLKISWIHTRFSLRDILGYRSLGQQKNTIMNVCAQVGWVDVFLWHSISLQIFWHVEVNNILKKINDSSILGHFVPTCPLLGGWFFSLLSSKYPWCVCWRAVLDVPQTQPLSSQCPLPISIFCPLFFAELF